MQAQRVKWFNTWKHTYSQCAREEPALKWWGGVVTLTHPLARLPPSCPFLTLPKSRFKILAPYSLESMYSWGNSLAIYMKWRRSVNLDGGQINPVYGSTMICCRLFPNKVGWGLVFCTAFFGHLRDNRGIVTLKLSSLLLSHSGVQR